MPAPEAHHHQHPSDPRMFVFGKKLGPGDVLKEGDVYSSTNRTWEPAPCAGLTLQDGNAVTWIRPEPCPPERELVQEGNLLVERRHLQKPEPETPAETASTE